MRLVPREEDKLALSHAGFLAQRRLARGLRLSCPEAEALIANQLLEMIREGELSVAELGAVGKRMLGHRQVQPGVAAMLPKVQVEGTFRDGTKLVTVHDPVCAEDGDFSLALHGSFLPTPDLSAFEDVEDSGATGPPPGAVEVGEGAVALNVGREAVFLPVTSRCDRPIQVGSHFHFFEANRRLEFDRGVAFGRRLNIPSGASVRFEPGETKTVALVGYAGRRVAWGGNGLSSGPLDDDGARERAVRRAVQQGFAHAELGKVNPAPPFLMPRREYALHYGPTVGDRVRLGDTTLWAVVENDATSYGEESKFGGGKAIREGMGQAAGVGAALALDAVITNALVIDYTGVFKADVGIKAGRISGIGKAGNPDTMAGVSEGMVIGVNTEVYAGEGSLLTAGGVDTHVHFICPQLAEEAIASGITTLLGGGTGPAEGSRATTCTPGPQHLRMMLQATDGLPLNFGFTGKGNTSRPEGLEEVIEAGAVGLKLHEDWGTTPAAIDCCLGVAEAHDVQVTIHTDTLNEAGCVEDTLGAFRGRSVHTYHSEGAGGGHAPDIIRVCGEPNVIPSSTNPTRPFTVNTVDEHLDMLMVCHHLSPDIPEDVAFAESRIRRETIAAEDRLHDMGAISIISSDSQAMGRIGEVITRTWQTASKMRQQQGPLPEDAGTPGDNLRIKRYIAKYTINPAVAHGMGHIVGSVEVGKLADLCLWEPAFFGVKPRLVLKGGEAAWCQMGDPNASIPTPQPVRMRPMFAGLPSRAASECSIAFVSDLSVRSGTVQGYRLRKRVEPVRGCRAVTKRSMKLNDALPKIEVDPETYSVCADGEHLTCEPAKEVPLARRYLLF
mmetsp:Transcript_10760/g.30225  ORF Transcript_10760/g.30225 Transcript_10760/m.30225 type:complete len:838 (-) Transcript_10760:120-2633(-)